jgi:hypothetical protein
MQTKFFSIPVEDQDHALRFYTSVLGFQNSGHRLYYERNMGPIIAVIFEDTCGNLINLVQPLV